MNKSEWKKIFSITRKEIRKACLARSANEITQDQMYKAMNSTKDASPQAYDAAMSQGTGCTPRSIWFMIQSGESRIDIKRQMWANSRAFRKPGTHPLSGYQGYL